MIKCNSHVHSPYSFSYFSSIEELVKSAKNENINVLGINDFFTTSGFFEFEKECYINKIYPLFNIELLCFSHGHNMTINDPYNAGRIYLVGKGVTNPILPELLLDAKKDQKDRVIKIIEKVNIWLDSIEENKKLDLEIVQSYGKEYLGERHVARAIKNIIKESSESFLRDDLLKKGKIAYVEESNFLSIDQGLEIIKSMGAIPCYPLLLDQNNKYTEFEEDLEKLYKNLMDLDIRCVEIIPNRNSELAVKKYTEFFNNKNFIILYGSEHNSPDKKPLAINLYNEEIENISYKGCCAIASHQNHGCLFDFDHGDQIIKNYIGVYEN
jgi:predicted metal-dependent phosphoesterase TrpH